MLPESDDEKIRSVRAKKGNDSVDFFGFDQVPGYLHGVATPLGNCRLHQFLVNSPSISFDATRYIGCNCDDDAGVRRRWLNNSDCLQGRAKKLAG